MYSGSYEQKNLAGIFGKCFRSKRGVSYSILYLKEQAVWIFVCVKYSEMRSQQIYEGVWGEEYAHEKGIIMSYIRHIRQKLEYGGSSFDYIENIRGVGYRFKKTMGLSGNR